MEATQIELSLEQLAAELAGRASSVEEVVDLLRCLLKSTLQRILDTELSAHLSRPVRADNSTVTASPNAANNRKNGSSKKTVQGEFGPLTLDIPRDRDGTFEPQLIGKYQRRLAGFDD